MLFLKNQKNLINYEEKEQNKERKRKKLENNEGSSMCLAYMRYLIRVVAATNKSTLFVTNIYPAVDVMVFYILMNKCHCVFIITHI